MKPPKTQRPRKQPVKPGHAQPQLAQSKLIQIEKPIYGGAFLARMEGKAVFVPLTLPGEQVRARITQSKRGYDTADPDEIISASPDRIAPGCPHFGPCGGCHYQHTNYATQLAFKQTILRETLERGGVTAPATIDVLAAEPWNYRNRIRLAFDEAENIGYRGRRSNAVIPVSECPIAAPLLVKTAKAAAEIAVRFASRFRPSEISLFCDATESALLASLFIAGTAQSSSAQTKARFEDFARAVQEQIPALKGAELVAEGQAAQPPRTVAQWGAPFLNYCAAGFDYRVDHGAFFQVNRFLVDALVERVTDGYKGSLAWDLYAGVGLFARRLTANFARVVAVESAASATGALDANLKGTTGTAVRAETLDFLRRNRQPANDPSTRPDLVVVDPPRTGLGAEITALLVQAAAPALVYVSCDPATLTRDLRTLISSGYEIEAMTLADLFPQTFHLETVVRMRRA
jgi:23S rRNA (uracil1939-C5)-methyltransferase